MSHICQSESGIHCALMEGLGPTVYIILSLNTFKFKLDVTLGKP